MDKGKGIDVESLLDSTLKETPWSEQAIDILMKSKPEHKMPDDLKERMLRHLEDFQRELQIKERPLDVRVVKERVWIFLPKYSCGCDAVVLDMDTLTILISELQCALRSMLALRDGV